MANVAAGAPQDDRAPLVGETATGVAQEIRVQVWGHREGAVTEPLRHKSEFRAASEQVRSMVVAEAVYGHPRHPRLLDELVEQA